MIAITKDKEPQSLTRHRSNTHADYANYAHKKDLSFALIQEQRGICCYCMRRIHLNAMKIEHWLCQEKNPKEDLNYHNLLGACSGGMGKPPSQQHCDTRKAANPLKWNPSNPSHMIEDRIRYDSEGTIESLDKDFNNQLNNSLNLNIEELKSSRKFIFDEVKAWIKKEKVRAKGKIPRSVLEKELHRWIEKTERTPFCGVAVWALKRKLERA